MAQARVAAVIAAPAPAQKKPYAQGYARATRAPAIKIVYQEQVIACMGCIAVKAAAT